LTVRLRRPSFVRSEHLTGLSAGDRFQRETALCLGEVSLTRKGSVAISLALTRRESGTAAGMPRREAGQPLEEAPEGGGVFVADGPADLVDPLVAGLEHAKVPPLGFALNRDGCGKLTSCPSSPAGSIRN
jgi:hypothetical protein